nr:RecName: Full=Photosystem I reaction center subunit N; Short=PSI-N [Pisum sativum]
SVFDEYLEKSKANK